MKRNILEYLEQTVRRVPERTAFSSEEEAMPLTPNGKIDRNLLKQRSNEHG